MSLTTAQRSRVERMAKQNKFFPEIADALGVPTYILYREFPGGVRVILGKDAYKARESTAPRGEGKRNKKTPAKKRKAKKAAKHDW